MAEASCDKEAGPHKDRKEEDGGGGVKGCIPRGWRCGIGWHRLLEAMGMGTHGEDEGISGL